MQMRACAALALDGNSRVSAAVAFQYKLAQTNVATHNSQQQSAAGDAERRDTLYSLFGILL